MTIIRLIPPAASVTIQVHFSMVCHLTLGNTLSISVSRRNEARHTRMAAGMLNQLELTMKSPMTPSRNTFSYQWESYQRQDIAGKLRSQASDHFLMGMVGGTDVIG